MKKTIIFLVLLSGNVHSSDSFVIVSGNEVYSEVDIDGEFVCIEGANFTVKKKPGKHRITLRYEIDIENKVLAEKIGYIGRCSGEQAINAAAVSLPESSQESRAFRERAIAEFGGTELPIDYDQKLNNFYQEISRSLADVKFKVVSRKWPISGQDFLLEQCLQVVAVTGGYPSYGKNPVSYAEKYMRSIVSDGSVRVINESTFDYMKSHCECDEPRKRSCQMIEEMQDLNGNGHYDYATKLEQPEGAIYEVYEYNGEGIELIQRLCTGEMASPYGSIKCP